ncbi:hypothetical protein JW977_00005 [Candidatus Falkowbacteria bacterium]|nr:hypothetical protein [Candidatus Falkowbacteria bacterium]
MKECATGCPLDELGETADTLREFLAGTGPPDNFIRGLAEHFATQFQKLETECTECQATKKTDEKVAEHWALLVKIQQELKKPKILRRGKCQKREVA